MRREFLTIHSHPELSDARMVLGLSGWMDGGDVSTGTVEYLAEKLDAQVLADIASGPFCIYNFPGSMEVSALFRPHTKIEDGLTVEFDEPMNRFWCSAEHRLILFDGKEPNLRWPEFADCIFRVASEFGVRDIHFVGSVAGAIPHTKSPRFFGAVSEEQLKPFLSDHALVPSNYEGPSSFITYLLTRAPDEGVRMNTVVAEVPSYVQGRNPKCIHGAVEKLAAMLDLTLVCDDLKLMSEEFDQRLEEAVKNKPELGELIRKMEEAYDEENRDEEGPDTDMDELRDWFEKQNFRLE
jgi:proteasome assembly chaperone (PAC2) family protein